jgi:RimJ/RimL family protein N-acetyltransferase
MYSHHIRAAVAAERQIDLVAQAETARFVREARARRRLDAANRAGKPVFLRDGSAVLIRQVRSADAALVADGFSRLSAESRRMRFLLRKDQLSSAELRYLTDIDHHNHEAIGALSRADGRGVGIARFIRHAEDPQSAEIAVTVIDEWQQRGLGITLMDRLTHRAHREGIRRFTALVSADNAAVLRLMRHVNGKIELIDRDETTLDYEIALAPQSYAR